MELISKKFYTNYVHVKMIVCLMSDILLLIISINTILNGTMWNGYNFQILIKNLQKPQNLSDELDIFDYYHYFRIFVTNGVALASSTFKVFSRNNIMFFLLFVDVLQKYIFFVQIMILNEILIVVLLNYKHLGHLLDTNITSSLLIEKNYTI